MTLLPSAKLPALPVAAESLVPHRGPMLLIDRLVSCTGVGGTVEARVKADNPFLGPSGELEPLAAVELLAQAFAACKGYADLADGSGPGKGFLVGARKVVTHDVARVGDVLQVNVAAKGEFDGFAVVEGEVRHDGRLVATGSLKLWVPREGRAGEEC